MRFVLAILFMFLAGCIEFNKTIHTYDGKTTTCLIAMQDEGGVCWHGSHCKPDIGPDPAECINTEGMK